MVTINEETLETKDIKSESVITIPEPIWRGILDEIDEIAIQVQRLQVRVQRLTLKLPGTDE